MSGGLAAPCGRLPLPLTVCPCCGAGIKPSRGWTWVDPKPLFDGKDCGIEKHDSAACSVCPIGDENLARMEGKMGLLWIGEKFYPTPRAWTDEVRRMGVSRRIPAVPREFKLGETWVLVAHRKAIEKECQECRGTEFLPKPDEGFGSNVDEEIKCEECAGTGKTHTPAIFHAFRPTEVQYVVTGKETKKKLKKLEERGITPVKVEKADGNGELPFEKGEQE